MEDNSSSNDHKRPKLSIEDSTELNNIVSLLWGKSNQESFIKVFLGGW